MSPWSTEATRRRLQFRRAIPGEAEHPTAVYLAIDLATPSRVQWYEQRIPSPFYFAGTRHADPSPPSAGRSGDLAPLGVGQIDLDRQI